MTNSRTGLKHFRYLITDMDGVLWRGQEPMPGLVDFIRFLRQANIRLICATNNASTLAAKLADRLQGWGTDIVPEEIVTSSTATADYLAASLPAGAPIYVIGMEGLRAPLRDAGLTLIGDEAPIGQALAVVIGIDWQVTYQQLKRAAQHIRAGARFIGTNGDRTFPSPEGIVPGNGALLAFVEAGTDHSPILVGKPEPVLYETALTRLHADPAATLVLGDRMETDILGAVRLGLKSVLVLSGVTTEQQLPTFDYQPDWVFNDIADLTQHWQAAIHDR